MIGQNHFIQHATKLTAALTVLTCAQIKVVENLLILTRSEQINVAILPFSQQYWTLYTIMNSYL